MLPGETSVSHPTLLVSQPVDNQQAMVRRESVVNLENFKKQYVRRRWKVCGGLGEWVVAGGRGRRLALSLTHLFLLSGCLSFPSALSPCATT